MSNDIEPKRPLDYAQAPPKRTRLPSPWLIPTLAGNMFFWIIVSIAITFLAIAIKVLVRSFS